MGIKVGADSDYVASIKKLFPKGEYWEKQFSDPNSDCFLFIKTKIDELTRYKKRMSDLQQESVIQTATETIEDWERVIHGAITTGLDISQRRALLLSEKSGNVNIAVIKEIAQTFGITITDIVFPFRSAFFGFSYFAINRITSPASFSVLYIYATEPDEEKKEEFESHIKMRVLANYIIYFKYGGN